MEITEVRIKLMEESGERLQAFCSITIDDCFVIRDLKIIEGTNGPFVAMPSRKLTAHCPTCSCKNHLRASYCNQCGNRLKDDRAVVDSEGRAKLYADIAHPINSGCREIIQNRVVDEFRVEQERAKQPDYVSRYEDFDVDVDAAEPHSHKPVDKTHEPAQEPRPPHRPVAQHPSPRPDMGPKGPRPAGGTKHSNSQPPGNTKHSGGPKNKTSGGPRDNEFGAGIF